MITLQSGSLCPTAPPSGRSLSRATYFHRRTGTATCRRTASHPHRAHNASDLTTVRQPPSGVVLTTTSGLSSRAGRISMNLHLAPSCMLLVWHAVVAVGSNCSGNGAFS